MNSYIDYEKTSMSIQEAMVDHAKLHPDKSLRPDFINWGGRQVKTFDCWEVPSSGIVRAEILHSKPDYEQGFDLSVNGWLELGDGSRTSLLRTWKDDRYEDFVKYPFFSSDGVLRIWNVYKMHYRGAQVVEERRTENAGFWIEKVSSSERVYHCSPGGVVSPDFDAFIFRVEIMDGF